MSVSNQSNYFSWTIVSPTEAKKHCDKSVFDYDSTGIPQGVKSFFTVNDLMPTESLTLILIKDDEQYDARIRIDQTNRAKLMWDKKLAKKLQRYKELSNVILKFQKIDKIHYGIDILIENDHYVCIDPELENIILITDEKLNKEGKRIAYYTTKYERVPKNRVDAIKIHGTTCQACGFDFKRKYGELGKDYIEVHHKKPLFSLNEEIEINPKTDLACVCANCHRMLHRQRNRVLDIEELKNYIEQATKAIQSV